MARLVFYCFCCLFIISSTSCDELQKRANVVIRLTKAAEESNSFNEDNNGINPVNYLKRFGYLPEEELNNEAVNYTKVIEKAASIFQDFLGLEKSRIIDDPTVIYMKRSRCGIKDIFPEYFFDSGDIKDDSDQQPVTAKWQTRLEKLTYRIVKYPRRLINRKSDVDEVFRKAFGVWEAVIPLKFERSITGKAHIDINFVRSFRRNQDNVIIQAEAIGPPKFIPDSPEIEVAPEGTLEGDINFNDHIPWVVDQIDVTPTSQGLLGAAIHQIGHALGLNHSRSRVSKMFPLNSNKVKLTDTDKSDIQKIYPPPRQHNNFFLLNARGFHEKIHERLEGPSMDSLDDCVDYAERKRFNVTIWDRCRGTCTNKSTPYMRRRLSLYTGTGKYLEAYDVASEDKDSTELESDVEQWLEINQCDLILRLKDWPVVGKQGFKCKTLKEDECFTMLFRLEKNRFHPDLLIRDARLKN